MSWDDVLYFVSLDAPRQGLRFVTLRYTPGYHPTPIRAKEGQ